MQYTYLQFGNPGFCEQVLKHGKQGVPGTSEKKGKYESNNSVII